MQQSYSGLYSDCTVQSVQLSHMTPLERVKFPTPGQARPDSVMSAHVRSLLIWQSELIRPSYHNQLSSLSRQTWCWFDSFKVSQPAVRTDHRQLTPADQWSESQDLSPWFCLLCLCLPCCVFPLVSSDYLIHIPAAQFNCQRCIKSSIQNCVGPPWVSDNDF